jgi:mannose-1-phosphate guanylyltransferase/phosphomannomutase
MKAVIMAGGEGTRLRPLTLKMPKPLVPVLGESVLSYIIRLLKKHGITDTALTLMFLPDLIKNQYKNHFEGVNLFYFEEDKPLGTAGSVKNTHEFLLDKNIQSHEDFFLVISGDAVCDTDIAKAAEFHRSSQSDVTIVLSRAENPLEFGGVLTDTRETGKILTFIEKPAWSQVFTDAINTGIYFINNKILENIPDGRSFDFGKDLFPFLLKNNYKLSGYLDENYWCDVGDLDAYYECNKHAVDGMIKIIKESANYKDYKNNNENRENKENKCSRYSVIGKNCEIGENCEIIDSIIHDGVKIGANTKIINSIICRNTQIGSNVIIDECCSIGENCVIKDKARIFKGVKIWNNQEISEGEKVMSNLIFSRQKTNPFDSDEGITGIFNDSLTPEYCVKIGAGAGIASSDFKNNKTGRIGVMYSKNLNRKNKNISKLVRDSILCGIVSSGAKSYDFGEGFDSLAAFAAGTFKLDCVLFADRIKIKEEFEREESEEQDIIKIFDYNALAPSRPFERKFDAALSRDDYKPPVADELYETEIFEGLSFLYFSELIKNSGTNLNGMKICVNSPDINKPGSAAFILKKALSELSADVCDISENQHDTHNADDTLVLTPEPDGFFIQARYNNISADFWHICAIIIKDMIKNGEREIAMPYLAPHALQIVAEEMGASVLRYISCSFDDDVKSRAKSKIIPQYYLKDACFAAIKLCAILYSSDKSDKSAKSGQFDKSKSGKNLEAHLKELPVFFSKNIDIEAEDSQKTTIMRILNSDSNNNIKSACGCSTCRSGGQNIDYRAREGIKFDYLNGFVNVVPKRGSGFRLIAEAASAEAAEEILDLTNGKIKSIIEIIKNKK